MGEEKGIRFWIVSAEFGAFLLRFKSTKKQQTNKEQKERKKLASLSIVSLFGGYTHPSYLSLLGVCHYSIQQGK